MEYTIKELADLAGISTRTLRYYHEIGLLPPAFMNQAGYRLYGQKEVDSLQHILMYKALGLELSQIKAIMADPEFDKVHALEDHLKKLLAKKKQLEIMIENVTKTMDKEKGMITMTDQEKFEGLKQQLVKDNEMAYGDELRLQYDQETIQASKEKVLGLTKEEYETMKEIEEELRSRLNEAVKTGKLPAGPEGREIAVLHKQWLSYSWPVYSPQAHKGLVEMYTADKRFNDYYDVSVTGCAEFLKEAVQTHVK